MKKKLTHICTSLLNSYSQVFFSDNLLAGLLVLLATFSDLFTGIAGLIAASVSVFAAELFGLAKCVIAKGSYTFNSMLAGLAAGAYFQPGTRLYILLVLVALFSLLLSSAFTHVSTITKLPFLSLPFILSTWILLVCAKHLSTGLINYRTLEHSQSILFESNLVEVLPSAIVLFFKTLALIFFQKSIVAGVLVAAAILIYSRISFVLSVTGFVAGYIIHLVFHPFTIQQEYISTAFNYILSAIAIGGFFLIPGVPSFMLVLVSTALIFLISSIAAVLDAFQLPLFSVPFTCGVWLVVAAVQQSRRTSSLKLVAYQHYSPEKNLYATVLYEKRFVYYEGPKFQSPFFGAWTVSQGHDGDITHKNDHRHALDFVVTDEHIKTFKLPGKNTSDFFCYGLPVLAPGDGTVVKVIDNIPDNAVGQINLDQNWGNLVVIQHNERLYTQLGHLLKGSIGVKEGDKVKTSEILGLCGNSGRSPEPHLHLQFQATELVGEKTISMPIHNYLVKKNGSFDHVTFGIPSEGQIIQTPETDPELKKAFSFRTGEILKFTSKGKTNSWEVKADERGTYLYDEQNESCAFYILSDGLIEFTYYNGVKNSLLHNFFIAANKVVFCSRENFSVHNEFETGTFYTLPARILHDFTAPFKTLIKTTSEINVTRCENEPGLNINSNLFTGKAKKGQYTIKVDKGRIAEFKTDFNNICFTAKNIS